MQVSKPYSSFFSDESLTSMQAKADEPPRADVAENDMQLDNVAAQADQAQAEDQDYGDGDADMYDGGFDED